MNTKKIFLLILVLIVIGGMAFYVASRKNNKIAKTPDLNINSKNIMELTSPAFQNNQNIPPKYTCDGENINPPLEISDAPAEAKSLALIMDDPDAPLAGGFVHWVVFNINPGTNSIAENSVPQDATEGMNNAGRTGYTSPCPPTGTHHYFFKLYALDAVLSLGSSATREDVEKAMEKHILDQATLVGLYQRQ